jgi:WD40 repeat protein
MANLTDGEEVILDVKLFIDFRYFLTSTNFGNILVWKYMPNGKVDSNRKLIHNFSGHMQKPVTSIMPFKKSTHLFLSVSTDCTARIWSI